MDLEANYTSLMKEGLTRLRLIIKMDVYGLSQVLGLTFI